MLGAGSSVPFGIPAMKSFIDQFKERIEDDHNLIVLFTEIETALKESGSLVGYNIDFDLESLMVVLEDLASDADRPISLPTFAFMLNAISVAERRGFSRERFHVKNMRDVFGNIASEMLKSLRSFVFDMCIKPIRKGQSHDSYEFLDQFYGPLFSLIEDRIIDHAGSWIFTTNWDLCLKQWLEYKEIPIEDGTSQNSQRKTVLYPSVGWTDVLNNVKVVPLHGSFDLVNCKRFAAGKQFLEIQKVPNPEVYFDGKPEEIAKAFILYPLEAIGYEKTMRSPYLDMLIQLKRRLRTENNVFAIGFSFRDSIIASIFDEVVRENLEQGRGQDMKVFLIDSSPESIVENLKKRGYVNLANALVSIQCLYPVVLDFENNRQKVHDGMQVMIEAIVCKLKSKGINYNLNNINRRLEQYDLNLPINTFG